MSAVSLLLMSTTSFAAPISDLYVFGDSLSDSGALAVIAPGACPSAPYFDCRFSNGPVWAELVADELGVTGATAYAGGTNYAIGGQRSDQVLGGQIPQFLAQNGGVADPDALYAIWAGGNDFLQGNPDPTNAVENVLESILGLAAFGAKDFLIFNLPIADPWAFAFNSGLANGLSTLQNDLNINQFDVFSIFLDMTLNPSDYGFTNVTEPCLTASSVCTNPDEYLLWDAVHPTAATHKFIAGAVLDSIQVSAPATLIIFSLGFAGLIRLRTKA